MCVCTHRLNLWLIIVSRMHFFFSFSVLFSGLFKYIVKFRWDDTVWLEKADISEIKIFYTAKLNKKIAHNK